MTTDRDALVQAVLDALNVEDLRIAARLFRDIAGDASDEVSDAFRARCAGLDAAADALAALQEAETT